MWSKSLVVLLVVVLAAFGVPVHQAQATTPTCSGNSGADGINGGCTAAQAMQQCQAVLQANVAAGYTAVDSCINGGNYLTGSRYHCSVAATGNTYQCSANPNNGDSSMGWFGFVNAPTCAAGEHYDQAKSMCVADCSISAPPLGAQSSMTGNTVCHDGCKYRADIAGDSINFGAPTFAKHWGPVGESCANEPPPQPFDPNKPICHSIGTSGGQQECVDPRDNRHCVIFANGTKQCWMVNETGPRSTNDGTQASDREKAPNLPVPPVNIKDPVENGPPTSTTICTGGTCNTYNTNTYNGGGNNGGQGNSGDGGTDGGTGGDKDKPDAPGSAQGSADGTYESDGKSVSDVMGTAASALRSVPIVHAGENFFTVSVGGSCPVWQVPQSAYYEAMTFDYHCQGTLAEMLSYGGYLLLAVYAYAAFKIAVY
jgi:hypothetical protein